MVSTVTILIGVLTNCVLSRRRRGNLVVNRTMLMVGSKIYLMTLKVVLSKVVRIFKRD